MKVYANAAPKKDFSVEAHPQKPGYAQVRFFENIKESDNAAGWEYDEYVVVVRDSPDLSANIKKNKDAWHQSARDSDVGYMAAEQTKEAYTPLVQAAHKVAKNMDDATASTVPALFDGMQYDGNLIPSGSRINWHGGLKRAAVDLWDTKENNPENAPTLWEDINYRDGARVIPDTITATLAFAKNELGWWHVDGKIYKSKVAGNVYTPEVYPANWEVVNE